MRIHVLLRAVGVLLCTSLAARADEPSSTPPAAQGFQLALRTGYAVPMGKATGVAGDDLSKSFGGQVPLLVDLGGKVSPHFFIGAYIGVGFGNEGSGLTSVCSSNGVSCQASSARLGAQVIVSLMPSAVANPWLGYGLGYESASLKAKGPGGEATMTISGVEYAHLMAGVDFRINSTFGIGPFVDFAIGEYSEIKAEGSSTLGVRDISNKGTHQWLILGPRFVFFP